MTHQPTVKWQSIKPLTPAEKQAMVINLHRHNVSLVRIAFVSGYTLAQVKAIIAASEGKK